MGSLLRTVVVAVVACLTVLGLYWEPTQLLRISHARVDVDDNNSNNNNANATTTTVNDDDIVSNASRHLTTTTTTTTRNDKSRDDERPTVPLESRETNDKDETFMVGDIRVHRNWTTTEPARTTTTTTRRVDHDDDHATRTLDKAALHATRLPAPPTPTTKSTSSNTAALRGLLQHPHLLEQPQVPALPQDLAALRRQHAQKVATGELFNYSLPPQHSTTTTLTEPIASFAQKHNATTAVVVLVLSARANFEARHAIRDTWGQGQAVLFVVGGPDAPYNATHVVSQTMQLPLGHEPPASEWTQARKLRCNHKKKKKRRTCDWQLERYVHESVGTEAPSVQAQLEHEAAHYGDLLDVVHPDKYGSLPYKLRRGLQWVLQHMPATQWIVKADDDMVVHVHALHQVLLQPYHAHQASIVVGKIHTAGPVFRRGSKYIERLYPYQWYPPFPLGSFAYAVSRVAAQRVVTPQDDDTVTYYQGEDASLGIWLYEYDQRHANDDTATAPTVWINEGGGEFLYNKGTSSNGDCTTPQTVNRLVIGHKLTPDQIRHCHDTQQLSTGWNVSATTTTRLALQHWTQCRGPTVGTQELRDACRERLLRAAHTATSPPPPPFAATNRVPDDDPENNTADPQQQQQQQPQPLHENDSDLPNVTTPRVDQDARVLVLVTPSSSSRHGNEAARRRRRQAIRDTWGRRRHNHHSVVLFVVDDDSAGGSLEAAEAGQYRDLLLQSGGNRHATLLQTGLQWLWQQQQLLEFGWILWVPDDAQVRVDTLERVLLHHLNPAMSTVVGKVMHPPNDKSRDSSYPFADASFGVVLSREAVRRVVVMSTTARETTTRTDAAVSSLEERDDVRLGRMLDQYERHEAPEATPTLWWTHMDMFFTRDEADDACDQPWIVSTAMTATGRTTAWCPEWPQAWVPRAVRHITLCRVNPLICDIAQQRRKQPARLVTLGLPPS